MDTRLNKYTVYKYINLQGDLNHHYVVIDLNILLLILNIG